MRIQLKISNVLRLSLLFGLVWLCLGMAGFFGWKRVSAEVGQRAQAEAGFAVAAAAQRLAQADQLFAARARAEAGSLRTAAMRGGAPRMFQGQGEPFLTFGRGVARKPVAERVAARSGGAAMILVLSGDVFTPVDSSLKTAAGAPALLDGIGPSSPYQKLLRAGRPAEGPVRVDSHAYYASFLPIKSQGSATIGAFGGLYPLEGLDEITRELRESPVFAHGFLVAADNRDEVGFSALGVVPAWLATHLKEVNQGGEIQGAVLDGYAITRSPEAKSGLRVIAGVSQSDVAFSTIKLVGAALTFLAMVIVVALCLAWLLARRLTEALAQAERSRVEAEAAQAALTKELDQAARYVQSLLPEPTRQGPVGANWLYRPSAGLGGDAFGYHWLDDNRFAFYLLDVCGHGVGAALLATTVMNVIRAQTVQADFANPSSVLAALNDAFPMAEQNDMYFTMWYGVYDAGAQQVRYASGGHHPAILIAPDGQTWLLQGKGAAIGCFKGVQYPVFDLAAPAGARLYVFSDGLFEVERKQAKDMLTFDEFVGIIVNWRRQHPDRELGHVLETIQEIQGKLAFDDDCSLVEVSFRPTGQVRLVA